jgi:hypothetical protein
MDRAPQVDVDDPAPVFVRHLRDRTRHDNARVAEDDVNLAEQAEGLVREVDHVVEVPDVAHHAVRVKPLGVQPCHSPFQRRLIDVGKHHAGSAAGELGGGGQANAIGAAGDDCSAAREVRDESAHKTEPYFRQLPASMGRVTPVMYRDSSEAKNSTALLMSTGSTHGIGSVWNI